jgi:cation diffusion facilitator family transporter
VECIEIAELVKSNSDSTVPKIVNSRASLARYAWLSIFAALTTMGLKSLAFWLTGSMGLLSDALESIVNLIGATVAFCMLTVAARPADPEHEYGHTKAEYFASGAEGALILVAAIAIAAAAVPRLLNPQPLEQTAIGLITCAIASGINFGVARVLLNVGKQYGSITLEADARHLMTDVWTSAGVILGVALVAATGWNRLDPLVALVVAMNILWTGYALLRRSILGLMDTALPADELAAIEQVLVKYRTGGIDFHALRTRQAASRRFVSVHILVPGKWTVQQGHEMLEQIEADIRTALGAVHVDTHLEPIEDPASFADIAVERE